MPEGSADWPPSSKDVLCQAFMPDGSGSATVRRRQAKQTFPLFPMLGIPEMRAELS